MHGLPYIKLLNNRAGPKCMVGAETFSIYGRTYLKPYKTSSLAFIVGRGDQGRPDCIKLLLRAVIKSQRNVFGLLSRHQPNH